MAARRWPRIAGVSAALVVLIGTVLTEVPSFLAAGRASPAASGVEKLLLIGLPTNMGLQPAFTGVGVFHPETGSWDQLLDTLFEPTPSPDARDLFFPLVHRVDDEPRMAIVDLASDTLQQRWSADIAVSPMADLSGPLASLTASRDRVYVAYRAGPPPQPINVVALDRVDGFERRRWFADTPDAALIAMQIRISADGGQLFLITMPSPSQSRNDLALGLTQFRLSDRAPRPVQTSRLPGVPWMSRSTADGQTLYGIDDAYAGRPLSLRFMDLASASLERLDLPLAPPVGDWLRYEQGVSADGRYLYVLAPTLGRLVKVDLVERRIAPVLTVDASQPSAVAFFGLLGSLLVSEAYAKTPVTGDLQVSADGQRVYAVGMTQESGGVRALGVMSIDTRDWRVVDRWLPRVEPADVLLSQDGRYLFVQESPWAQGPAAGVVHVVDTSSGAEVLASQALPRVSMRSIGRLYQTAYGHSLASSQVPALAPLASFKVTAEPGSTIAGRSVHIDAQFVDPRTGQTVQAGQTSVRFDPPASVAARLVRNDSAISTELQRSGFGVYTGSVVTGGSPGTWTLLGEAEFADGATRNAELPEAVLVQKSFAGTDGRDYVLQVTSHPLQPRVDTDTQIVATFVDADSRTPLPADVDVVNRPLDQLDVACFGQGVISRTFQLVGHGEYARTVRIWARGTWQVWVSVPDADGRTTSFLAGTLSVLP